MTEEKKRKGEVSAHEVSDRLKKAEKNTTARFKTIQEQIKRVDISINARAKQILDKQITRLEKLSDIAKLDDKFKEMEERLDYLGERMRFMIHKETILTEVSRLARDKGDWLQLAQFHLAIMRAFNQNEEWWGLNEHELTIIEWYGKIMNLLGE